MSNTRLYYVCFEWKYWTRHMRYSETEFVEAIVKASSLDEAFDKVWTQTDKTGAVNASLIGPTLIVEPVDVATTGVFFIIKKKEEE